MLCELFEAKSLAKGKLKFAPVLLTSNCIGLK